VTLCCKRALVAAVIVASHAAVADPKHVLVLHSEGNADAAARAKIDVQVLKLAKNIEGNVEPGDITYSDASAAVGCSATDQTCKDEVLATMGVDELVVTTVGAGASGELKVTVRRYAKAAPAREAVTTIPVGQPADAKMNTDIGPLFGVVTVAPPPPAPPPPVDKPAKLPDPAIVDANPGEARPADVATTPAAPAPAVRTAQVDTVSAAPSNRIEDHAVAHDRRPLYGFAAGGALMLIGVSLWYEASLTQDDINNAPTPRTPNDFKKLTDLESSGDTYALLGNVSFVGGVALAAVSGYFFWRDRAHHGVQHARLVPAVFDHGAGIALGIGAWR
jgi:hypothetical protein